MFTPAACVTAIKTNLEAVAGAGVVHEYRRLLRNQSEASARLFDGTRINAAFISMTGVPEVSREFGNPAVSGNLTTFGFAIEMFYGLDDAGASEKSFRDLVWATVNRFNSQGLILADASHQEPMTARIAYIELADATPLHYAELVFSLRGRTSPA